jgi:hypothetical protein
MDTRGKKRAREENETSEESGADLLLSAFAGSDLLLVLKKLSDVVQLKAADDYLSQIWGRHPQEAVDDQPVACTSVQGHARSTV